MDVVEAKPKKQSVSDIWQSLKSQFTSTRKHTPKSRTNWNAYSKKTESSRDSLLTSLDGSGATAVVCDTQPFILGIPKQLKNTTNVDDLHKGLRSTAKAVLHSLEEEKQARAVLVNLEGEKKPTWDVQVDLAAATSNTSILDDAPQPGTCQEQTLEQPFKIPAAKNTDEGTTFPPLGGTDTAAITIDNGVESVIRTSEKGVKRIESHSHDEGNEKIDEHPAPKQSQSVHLVKVNSTFSHLKSKLTKSTDEEGEKDQETNAEGCQFENNISVSDLNHLNPENSLIGSINNHEELKQNNESIQDVKIVIDDPNSTRKVLVETTTGAKQKPPADHHYQACAESNLPSGFSTLNVDSCDVQDEPPTSATDEELMKIINKDVNCLHDAAIDVRYEALHSLHRALLGDFVGEVQYLQTRTMTGSEEDNQEETDIVNTGLFESDEKFAWCVEEVVLKPLLKILSDSSERCRYLSVTILIALLQSIPRVVTTLLPYIIPVLSSRFPIKSIPTEDPSSKVEIKVVEKSEDIRLLLVKLLHGLLRASKAMIHPFSSDTATILTAAACDSSPEVLMVRTHGSGFDRAQRVTFDVLASYYSLEPHTLVCHSLAGNVCSNDFFGEICGTKLKPVAKLLISIVIRSLSHNRHRVRVAAVRAVHRLVLCGAHESIYDLTAFRDPNTVPIRAFYHPDPKTQYLALLAGDRSIQVREQLLRTVASWLRELDERKEHECRLVPYLLSGFTDESPIIQNLAFQLMEEVGHQYEEENENEVKDIQIYLPEDIDDLPAVAGKPLPTAFKSRPCLGSRILVRSCTSVMLHALGGDLDAWTSGTKSLAADFLHTMLLFVEDHITMHLQQVIVLLLKALKDPLIETKVSHCANVIGHFVDPTAYLLIILPRITGELYSDASVLQLAQAVKLLARLMQGSPASRLTSHIPEICSVLSESDLMKSIQLDLNQSIVAVTSEMVRAWTEQVKEETISILWILLNAASAADFCGRLALEAESTLQTLATTCKILSGDALIGTYGEMILDLLPHPQFWAMRSLDVIVFCRVVQVAPLVPPNIIERMFLKISWFGRGSWDPDTKLWLLRAVQKMVKVSVATAAAAAASATSSSEQGVTISKIEDGMVMLLESFLVPCLDQVREGATTLRVPTLDTIFEIISNGAWNGVVPGTLARALSDLERFDHKQEPDPDDEEDLHFSAAPRETLLEILERLRKTT